MVNYIFFQLSIPLKSMAQATNFGSFLLILHANFDWKLS